MVRLLGDTPMIMLDPVSGKRVTVPSTKVGLLSAQSVDRRRDQ